jgi:hypothetical protein
MPVSECLFTITTLYTTVVFVFYCYCWVLHFLPAEITNVGVLYLYLVFYYPSVIYVYWYMLYYRGLLNQLMLLLFSPREIEIYQPSPSKHSMLYDFFASTNSPGFIGGLLGLSHRVAPEAILGPYRRTVAVILSTEWAGVPCDVIGGLTLKARPVTGIQITQAAPAGIPSAIVMYQPVIAMSHEVFVDDLPHVTHRWPPHPARPGQRSEEPAPLGRVDGCNPCS